MIISRLNLQSKKADPGWHYTEYLEKLLSNFGGVAVVNPKEALEMAKKMRSEVIILANWKAESSDGDPCSPELVRSLKTKLPQAKIVLDPPCQIYQQDRQSLVKEEALRSGVSVILYRHLSEPLTINTYKNAGIF
ncbi:hypothetical protein A2Z22_00595 [Candidatus Woesebacteria bacterium RBG_16_34_12]|uniref:Uncharacterized protein n=1 Tax=Candidatus Woesebacteria bacterium RBG_16_34_12 TaxID=1802480 RepID=A0A1F7X918_9BACT|nr:MAG: hypothetical protein A2Z22_00595 [Candidatus Woesebacteria bacterium RBG_16_34_12]